MSTSFDSYTPPSVTSSSVVPYTASTGKRAASGVDVTLDHENVPSIHEAGVVIENTIAIDDVHFVDSPDAMPADASSPSVAVFTTYNPFDPKCRAVLELAPQANNGGMMVHINDRVRQAAALARMKFQRGKNSSSTSSANGARVMIAIQTQMLIAGRCQTGLEGTYVPEDPDTHQSPHRVINVTDVATCARDEMVSVTSDGETMGGCSRAFAQVRTMCDRWDEFGLLLLALSPVSTAPPASSNLWLQLRLALAASDYLDEERVRRAKEILASPTSATEESDEIIAPYANLGVTVSVALDWCLASIATIKANMAVGAKKSNDVSKQYNDFRQAKAMDPSLFIGVHGAILRAAARAVIDEKCGNSSDGIRTAAMKNTLGGRATIQFKRPIHMGGANDETAATQFEMPTRSDRYPGAIARLYAAACSPAFAAVREMVKQLTIAAKKFLILPPPVYYFDAEKRVAEYGTNPITRGSLVSVVISPQLRMMPGILNSSMIPLGVFHVRSDEGVSSLTKSILSGGGRCAQTPDPRFCMAFVRPGLPAPNRLMIGASSTQSDNDDGASVRVAKRLRAPEEETLRDLGPLSTFVVPNFSDDD